MRQLLTLLLLASCGSEVLPVGRRDLQYISTDCTGGINETVEESSAKQCAEATNLWAVEGRVETRPGYVGIVGGTGGSATQAVLYARKQVDHAVETYVAPTLGILDLSGLAGRVTSGGTFGRWLVGYSAPFSGFQIANPTVNSGLTRFKAEYWNGSEWAYLRVFEIDSFSPNRQGYHLSYASNIGFFFFAAPQDWTALTIDSQSAYWLRFNLLEADFDGDVTIDVDDANTGVITSQAFKGLFAAQFPTAKRYITVTDFPIGAYYVTSVTIEGNEGTPRLLSPVTSEPATLAVVPQFEEAFMGYGYRVTRHAVDGTTGLATVEDRDFAVGPGAPNDREVYPQLSEFPRAKYISFFKGRLWAAGILGEPYTVRWSMAQPYHKVWRELGFEVLAEHDNSPITGMYPLGEYMVIFKQDSIWMAYDSGVDGFGMNTYTIRQVVSGVGCVSNSSIKAIRGNLIFLAEDGIYRFDGATAKKVTLDQDTGADRLKDTMATVSPGRRPFAAAAHWRTRNGYILSFSTGGNTTNDTTLFWDYDADTWWEWDNIDAQHWFEDEGQYDAETLYFGDSLGNIYQFGVGRTDHGRTITTTLTSSRFGLGSNTKQRARTLEVFASNKTRECNVELLCNDETSGTSGTVSFTDSTEADWSDFSYASGASTDDNWTAPRRRARRIDFRKDFDWLQIKLTHNQKNQPFQLTQLTLGVLPLGNR